MGATTNTYGEPRITCHWREAAAGRVVLKRARMIIDHGIETDIESALVRAWGSMSTRSRNQGDPLARAREALALAAGDLRLAREILVGEYVEFGYRITT